MSPGRKRYAALGYALRVVKALPAPARERVLAGAANGVSCELPPFPDIVRLLEAAGGMPDGTRWQQQLAADRPDLQQVSTRDLTDTPGEFTGRLYLPPPTTSRPRAALVWVHGGAFVLGSLDQKEAHWPAVELAAAGIAVLSIDYRKCLRGVHYPAPQDDVIAAWTWATQHADELGVNAEQLHLGGGSAGACLAASTTLRLRDTGAALPASLYLAYPVLEGELPPATPEMGPALAARNLVSDEWVRSMFQTWSGTTSWTEPWVSPARAELAGLPPTYVLTCGRDVLRRSSEPYVARLREAGVDVSHELLPEAEHAPYDRLGSPEGERALEGLKAWLTGGSAALAARQSGTA